MAFKDEHEFLGPVDTAFLHAESAAAPMNIGAIAVFEGPIGHEALIKHVESRIPQIPAYQRRLIIPPFNLGQPRWVRDPDFDVRNHIFTVRLNTPGTDEQLRQTIGRLISSRLDRSKPLWEIYLVQGLSDNRSCLFFKVHHAMVDGIAAIELFTLLFDLSPDNVFSSGGLDMDAPPLPGVVDVLRESLTRELPYKVEMLHKLSGSLGTLGTVIANPERRRRFLFGLANLMNDTMNWLKPLAINGKNTGSQHVAWAEFPLQEVRAIRAKANASVNDVMLTVLAGAVDRYETLYRGISGRERKSVRILVPVNMRDEQHLHDVGNRISVLPIDVPLASDDPLATLQKVGEYTRTMKQSYLAISLDIILTLPALSPSLAQPLIWSMAPAAFSLIAHTWCTNVAGPPVPVYLMGHRLLHSYGFFPLNPSMGLACVVVSYNGQITMTLIGDQGIIPDVPKLREFLEDSYRALRDAAGLKPSAPVAEVPFASPRAEPPLPKPVVEEKPAPEQPEASVEQPEASVEAVPEVPAAVVEPDAVASAEEVVEQAAVAEEAPLPTPAEPVEPSHEIEAVAAETVEPSSEVEVAAPKPAELPVDEKAEAEPIVQPSEEPPVRTNGFHAAEHQQLALESVSPKALVVEEPTPTTRSAFRLFSADWADAFRQAINQNGAYRRASLHWHAGPLAFVLSGGPSVVQSGNAAVLMDLYEGECRSACSLAPAEANRRANFVIEGSYNTWLRVLAGSIAPLSALSRGDLRLTKGSLIRLLPFTQSAQELVLSAQKIPLDKGDSGV